MRLPGKLLSIFSDIIDNIDSCQFHVLSLAGGLGHVGRNCIVFQQGLIVLPFRGIKLADVNIVGLIGGPPQQPSR